jgi:hypothetical protein
LRRADSSPHHLPQLSSILSPVDWLQMSYT